MQVCTLKAFRYNICAQKATEIIASNLKHLLFSSFRRLNVVKINSHTIMW